MLLLIGHSFIKRGRMAAHRACMIAAVVTSSLFLVSYLVLSRARGLDPFCGARMVTSGLFLHFDFPHNSRGDHCSAGHHHSEPGLARQVRQTSRYCSMDLSDVAVRFGNGRGDLPHALQIISRLEPRIVILCLEKSIFVNKVLRD